MPRRLPNSWWKVPRRPIGAWAEDCYGISVNLSGAQHVYASRPLAADVVAGLGPDVRISDLEGDMIEIKYSRPRSIGGQRGLGEK